MFRTSLTLRSGGAAAYNSKATSALNLQFSTNMCTIALSILKLEKVIRVKYNDILGVKSHDIIQAKLLLILWL